MYRRKVDHLGIVVGEVGSRGERLGLSTRNVGWVSNVTEGPAFKFVSIKDDLGVLNETLPKLPLLWRGGRLETMPVPLRSANGLIGVADRWLSVSASEVISSLDWRSSRVEKRNTKTGTMQKRHRHEITILISLDSTVQT